ncbi:MAG: hypothetical protein HY744_12230 [Deltaproteobacteria bacterium]|nr:hypothetical protein [Deltaproteobacteria bacterium]
MKRRTTLPALAALGLLALLCGGCAEGGAGGDEQPPGTGGFQPGPPGQPPPYGSGSSYTSGPGGGETSGPPQCDETLRRCPHTFSLPQQGGEKAVEVRGTFAPDGWKKGVPMALEDGVWSAEIYVPWAQDVEYKFVVDGNWITDPGNPNKVDDGQSGYNSLLEGVTCDDWICEPP